jgi:diguanylate cyclase (GGDEF)-like protein
MRQVLRDGDVLARYGGEEFTALLVNTPLQEARAVAERLRSVVQAHDWHAVSAGLKVTVSVGLTDVYAGQSLQSAVTDADRQLYRAKHAGRNRVMMAADSLEPDRPHTTAA